MRIRVPSSITLMHPRGYVRHSRCYSAPARISSSAPAVPPGQGVDLGWLSPSRSQCRAKGWIDTAIREASDEMASDGLLYLIVPQGWRGRFASALRDAGWELAPPIVHLGVRGRRRLVIPLSASALTLAAEVLHDIPAPVAAALRAFSLFPALTSMTAPWRWVGLVARRAEGPPVFDWLADVAGVDARSLDVVAVQGWRGAGDSVVLHYAAEERTKSGVAKVSRRGASAATEGEALELHRSDATAAGARLPEVIGCTHLNDRPVTVMTRIEGVPASTRLRSRPAALDAVVEQVGGWLDRWNLITAAVAPLREDDVDRWVTGPARRIADELPEGARYLSALDRLCDRLVGTSAPRVSAHNDLTMYNVFLSDAGIGVIDWEGASSDALPLMDTEYMIVDAVAAVNRDHDRYEAWCSCFSGQGPHADAMLRWRGRGIDELRLSPDLSDFCHHAGWLHHACNEATASPAPEQRPFLAIASEMARRLVGSGGG
jgi:hypothetical protein